MPNIPDASDAELQQAADDLPMDEFMRRHARMLDVLRLWHRHRVQNSRAALPPTGPIEVVAYGTIELDEFLGTLDDMADCLLRITGQEPATEIPASTSAGLH